MDVSGKIVIITGGLGGIGIEIAKSLLKAGVKGISLLDLNVSQAKTILKDLQDQYGENKIIAIKTDITNEKDIKNAFELTIEKFKNLDIVINSAGVINTAEWEKEIEVNYKGCYKTMLLAMTHYLPKYKSGEEGIIVNIASIAGIDSHPVIINYGATKAALISLSRSYAHELFYDQYKVKFLVLCPGVTETPLLASLDNKELTDAVQLGLPIQKVDIIGNHVMTAIEDFKNGDVFVIEAGKMYKMQFRSRMECCI